MDASTLGLQAAERLTQLTQVEMRPGLSDVEVEAIEQRFGFTFADDHRAFLAAGLPVGPRWPDWRTGQPDELRAWLDRPVEGVLFDVEHNDFWYAAWGARPDTVPDAVAAAATHLARAPQLVPVFGHRYLPAGRGTWGSPVLSVVQTDVVHYGANLADYVEHEFARRPAAPPRARVPFWSDLAEA